MTIAPKIRLFCLLTTAILCGCSFDFYRTFGKDTETVPSSPSDSTDVEPSPTDTIDSDSHIDSESHTETEIPTEDTASTPTDSDSETVDTGNTDVSGTEDAGASDPDAPYTIGEAVLAHHWRFDNTLKDDVGGADATMVVPSDTIASDAFLTDDEITLTGGDPATSTYISLGSHLLTNLGGPASIELFATLHRVNYFPRIFEFGSGLYHYLNMTWNRGTEYHEETEEDISIGDGVIWWVNDMIVEWDSNNPPYKLDEMYHIVMTLEPAGGQDGALRIRWYTELAAESDIGPRRGVLDVPERLRDLNDEHCWLGMSHSDNDQVAGASYHDVKLWRGVLTQDDIEILHDLGPDQ